MFWFSLISLLGCHQQGETLDIASKSTQTNQPALSFGAYDYRVTPSERLLVTSEGHYQVSFEDDEIRLNAFGIPTEGGTTSRGQVGPTSAMVFDPVNSKLVVASLADGDQLELTTHRLGADPQTERQSIEGSAVLGAAVTTDPSGDIHLVWSKNSPNQSNDEQILYAACESPEGCHTFDFDHEEVASVDTAELDVAFVNGVLTVVAETHSGSLTTYQREADTWSVVDTTTINPIYSQHPNEQIDLIQDAQRTGLVVVGQHQGHDRMQVFDWADGWSLIAEIQYPYALNAPRFSSQHTAAIAQGEIIVATTTCRAMDTDGDCGDAVVRVFRESNDFEAAEAEIVEHNPTHDAISSPSIGPDGQLFVIHGAPGEVVSIVETAAPPEAYDYLPAGAGTFGGRGYFDIASGGQGYYAESIQVDCSVVGENPGRMQISCVADFDFEYGLEFSGAFAYDMRSDGVFHAITTDAYERFELEIHGSVGSTNQADPTAYAGQGTTEAAQGVHIDTLILTDNRTHETTFVPGWFELRER